MAFGIVLACLGLALIASPVLAARSRQHYLPQHGVKCRSGYKREKHGKKVYCVKQSVKKKPVPEKATTSPAPPLGAPAPSATATGPLTSRVTLHAHLDPTYLQNPFSPYEVTYTFSASATQQHFTAESVPVGGEEPAPLPSGSLALYSDGTQECSVEVGSAVDSSECTVEYNFDLGPHTITVVYTGGGQSVTETVDEDLKPIPTTTILRVSYVPGFQSQAIEPGVWQIGTLDFGMGSSPNRGPDVQIGCETSGRYEIHPDGCIGLEYPNQLAVYATATGNCSEPEIGGISLSEPQWSELRFRGPLMSPADIEAGTFHFRAFIWNFGGYEESETTTPLQFKPDVTLPPDC
jgi:hypothetical protein